MADREERPTASELYAEDVAINLPGACFSGPDAGERMIEYFDSQYEWCDKDFQRWYVDGETVFTIGTLHGTDNDGEEFEGVRFVDVHQVRDGRIVHKDVFNDLAEAGIVDYDAL
jgi:ketosteroid isomerase-like protein